MDQTKIYKVSELTRDIRFILEDTFQGIWVEGEISNLKVYPSGHIYFSLKDAKGLLKCVLFRSRAQHTVFSPEDGLHVLCSGKISVYDKRGEYQLYVDKIEPRGRGALQLAFEQLKKKLYEEGLFAPEHKKPLPVLPQRIGVVTSSAGAAIRDIIQVAQRRYPNIEIVVAPVRVQGREAKKEIVHAIEMFNEYNRYLKERNEIDRVIDIMIVTRGGGSLEDLWPFNEEIVARAIYCSDIPIVSAVGHEIDYTISDFIADMRAPTPSAAAEIVLPVKKELQNRIQEIRYRAHQTVKAKIERWEKAIETLRDSYVLKAPVNMFLQMKQQVDDLVKAADSSIKYMLQLRESCLDGASGKLKMLNPKGVLSRGYSITFKDGKVVGWAKEVKRGDLIETRFAKGSVKSRVEEIK
ncbi:MAG: exodeoxyribonuclease VII large subunit [Candidatus Omnitrophota bacterium]